MNPEHQVIVTKEDLILQRLDKLEVKMDLTREEIAALKVKSGIWGAISGLIGSAILFLGWMASK